MAVVPFPRRPSAGLPAGPAPPRRFVDTAAGRRIAYDEAGDGPPAVLVHGTLMTADDMRLGPMEALARRFRCIAFDRPGHGWSDHRRGADASLWAQVATLRAAVQALGLSRPVICGHSYGGAVALAYGLAHPDEVSGIVALAPICFPEPRLEQLLFGPRAVPGAGDILSDALGTTVDPLLLPALWRAMFLPQAMPERFRAGFPFARAGRPDRIVAEGENAAALWGDLARSALSYGTCRVPVRILCGAADIVVNPWMQGAPAAALIPGARLDLLPGTGHMLHHIHPEAVVAAVAAVAGTDGPAAAGGR
jgi:pimeloyl-ACP methyl ester carboxylesterase